jgi:hypothetical protein
MRILNIVCGVSVVLTTLHSAHLLQHHFWGDAPPGVVHSPAFWAGLAVVAVMAIFSLIGGGLLLKRGR